MSYVALYRKYRPLTFDDMVGQEHIVSILENQIVNNKISHAYIFSGTRGTGKTSAAKIFARAVNCTNPHNGNPCNECEACKSILSGETTDVVEMDAASNNSVENIRSVRQEVMYATTGVKYRVYIIDEAHMLSTSAFNALLKTLEEPPENVIFILATTEEHKLLPTILSRCIRFEFRKISQENIIKRIKYILEDSKIEYEEKALEYVARLSDGGMRDALSILERCANDESGKVTYKKLQELVGDASDDIINDIVDSIVNYKVNNVVELANNILSKGRDARYVTEQLARKFMELLIGADEETYKKISKTRLNYVIKELFKLDSDIRQSVNGTLLFKAKLIELTSNNFLENKEELLERIQELELRIERMEKTNGTGMGCMVENSKGMSKGIVEKKVIENTESNKTISEPQKEKNNKILFKEMDKLKDILVQKDNLQLYSALAGVKAHIQNEQIVFQTDNNFAYAIMNKDENKKMLGTIVKDILNEDCVITIDQMQNPVQNVTSFEEHMMNSDVPFTVVD